MKILVTILVLLSGFHYAHAQRSSPSFEVELDRLLSKLEVYESMNRAGIDTSEIRYAQAVFADQAFDLFLRDSSLYFQYDLVQRWFSLQIAKNPRFMPMVREAISLFKLYSRVEFEWADLMKDSRLSKFLEEIFPEKNRAERRSWISEQYHLWRNEIQTQLESNDPKIRWKGLRFAIQNRSDMNFHGRFAEQIIDRMEVEQKIRLLDDMIYRPEGSLKDFYLAYFLTVIPLKNWLAGHQQLFSKLFELGSARPTSAHRIIIALSAFPELAQAKVPLVRVLGTSQESYRWLYSFQGEGLMLAEQLLLFSENYRRAIFQTLINPSNLWSLDLIQLSFDSELRPTRELALLLTKAPATQDPRWFEWVMAMGERHRNLLIGEFTKIDRLYGSTSDLAFELQKMIFETALNNARAAYVIPLERFIKKSVLNPRLVEFMVNQVGAEILAEGKATLNKTFVKNIYFHPNVDQGTRMFWLEILLIKGALKDIDLVRSLVMGHGLENDFKTEIERAQLDRSMEAEIMRHSLIQTLLSDSQRHPNLSCQRVFSL